MEPEAILWLGGVPGVLVLIMVLLAHGHWRRRQRLAVGPVVDGRIASVVRSGGRWGATTMAEVKYEAPTPAGPSQEFLRTITLRGQLVRTVKQGHAVRVHYLPEKPSYSDIEGNLAPRSGILGAVFAVAALYAVWLVLLLADMK